MEHQAPYTGPATGRLLPDIDSLPGPRGWPLVGNSLQIEPARFHQQLEAWCAQYGPYYKLAIGRSRYMVVGDHLAVASLLRDRPEGFRRPLLLEQRFVEMGIPSGVFLASGEEWRRQRRMVMASLDPAHVQRFHPALLAIAGRLAARWRRAAQAGSEIDLQADLMRYTVDVVAGLALGAEVRTLEAEDNLIQDHLAQLTPALLKRVIAPFPTWRYLRTAADRKLEESVQSVLASVRGFIRDARERLAADPGLRAAPANLLEAMIVEADVPGSGIDDQQIAGNVITILLAGEDTSANTMTWLIHFLWRHPRVREAAIDEVRQVCGTATAPTLQQLDALDYLENCVRETMRLKPVAPFFMLEALRESVVNGIRLPPGDGVCLLFRTDSVSDRHWDAPAEFRPERWTRSDEAPATAAARATSMPFGGGARICPGRYLALHQIKLAMATLLARFDIEDVHAEGGGEVREHLFFTMEPTGVRMRLRQR